MIEFGPPVLLGVPPRTLVATYDAERVVAWQAHGAQVADRALATGRFDGPGWRTDRVTRLRLSLPSLAWRTKNGTRQGRERVLAVFLRRSGFDELVRRAIPGEDDRAVYPSQAAWRLAMRFATATVSWHADRLPDGSEAPWTTPRFGLSGAILDAFARDWVVDIEDHTAWLDDRTRVPRVRAYTFGGGDVR